MDNGKLYMQDDDGTFHPLGEIKDISAEEAKGSELSEEDKEKYRLLFSPRAISFSGTLHYTFYVIIYVHLLANKKYGIGTTWVAGTFSKAIDMLTVRHDTVVRIPEKRAKKISGRINLRAHINWKYKCNCTIEDINKNAFAPINYIDDAAIFVVKIRR